MFLPELILHFAAAEYRQIEKPGEGYHPEMKAVWPQP